MQKLTDTQSDLVDNTCAFFRQCTGEFGDVPKQFRTPLFWLKDHLALLEDNADAINRWAALPAGRLKKLVCESVEIDTDSHVNDEETVHTAEETATHAVEKITVYMQPEAMKLLLSENGIADEAAAFRNWKK